MKMIEQKKTGGEVRGDFFNLSIFGGPGTVQPMKLHSTYESAVSIPYRLTVTEEVEPGKDKNGNAEPLSTQKSYLAVAQIPCDHNGVSGTVELRAFSSESAEKATQLLVEEIGNKVLILTMRDSA